MLIRLLLLGLLLPAFADAGELSADKIERDAHGELDASGNVHISAKGIDIQAERIHFDLDSQTGDLYGATVNFEGGYTLEGGHLKRVDLEKFYGEEVVFTSCPDEDSGWAIVADEARLDKEAGVFSAKDARFKWGGVPVLYFPTWEHALTRRSGVLTPILNQSTRRGTEITLPLYWAASPSWDMTYSPQWMSERGLLSDLEWRHRSRFGQEQLQLRTVFDKQSKKQRSRILGEMAWTPFASIYATVNIDAVDDGLHIADFPMVDDNEAAAYLTSDASLAWRQGRDSVAFSSRFQQLLGGGTNERTLQILPRLQTRHIFALADRQEISIEHQSTLFQRDVGSDGLRTGIKSTWQVPWTMLEDAVSAQWTISGQGVGYDNYEFSSSTSSYYALASSLAFDTAFERVSVNRKWRHEIKPMIRFDISDVPDLAGQPRYDSNLIPLSFGNLMNGNRYSGWDRFERMARMSMLLESTLQTRQADGGVRNLLQGKIGLVWDEKLESVDRSLSIAPKRSRSNLMAEASWMPAAQVTIQAGGQHDPDLNSWVEAHAGFHWADQESQYVNILWQRTEAAYITAAESANISANIRFNPMWFTSLKSRYDLLRDRALDGAVGILYKHACWSINTELFQIYQQGTNSSSDVGVRFLLAFDGLGSFADK